MLLYFCRPSYSCMCVCAYMYMCMHMCSILVKVMVDCTIKDNSYVWHNQLHVSLFSSEKLEKHKHLKLVVSHLSTVFTYTSNHYNAFYIYAYICIHTYTDLYIYIKYL